MASEAWELAENPSRYYDYHWYSDDVPAHKFYLFIADIGRRLRHLMTDPGPIKMIDLCEQCAEGQITEDELSDRSDEHRPVSEGTSYAGNVADHLYWWVADRNKVYTRSLYYAAYGFAFLAAVEAGLLSPQATSYEELQGVREHPLFASVRDRTELEWGALVRDIYGPNPFCPPVVDSRWQTSDVVQIAQAIYDDRAFDRLPILADALMDAGCDSEEIIHHCRGGGPHTLGCWVVALILGKK